MILSPSASPCRGRDARITLFAIALLALSSSLSAKDLIVTSAIHLRTAAQNASPGDTILIAPGQYEACYIKDIHGKPDAPIRIVAADPKDLPVFKGGNVPFYLATSSYVIVDGIVATRGEGNNIQLDFCDHIVLANCASIDMADEGNNDGIKCPGVTDFLFYRCKIIDWGEEGSAIDMVGCARGLIMDCEVTFPNLTGHTANGVMAKGGSFDIGIYNCRFKQAGMRAIQFGGSTNEIFFHQKNLDQGFEAFDMAAMGNIIESGHAAMAFVTCRKCVFSYNTIINPEKFIYRILREGKQGEPQENTFSYNLIARGQAGINIGPDTRPETFLFEANYWHPLGGGFTPPEFDPAGGEDPQLDANHHPAPNGPAAEFGADAKGLEDAWKPWKERIGWAWEQVKALEASGAK